MTNLGTNYVRYIEPKRIGREMLHSLGLAVRLSHVDWEFWTTFDQIMKHILSPDTLLFVAPTQANTEAFMALNLHQAPNARFINVYWCGGTKVLAHLPHLVAAADHAAEMLDADWIEMSGRLAWERILSSHGFSFRSLTVSKEAPHVLRRRNAEGSTDNAASAVPRTAGVVEQVNGVDGSGNGGPAPLDAEGSRIRPVSDTGSGGDPS